MDDAAQIVSQLNFCEEDQQVQISLYIEKHVVQNEPYSGRTDIVKKKIKSELTACSEAVHLYRYRESYLKNMKSLWVEKGDAKNTEHDDRLKNKKRFFCQRSSDASYCSSHGYQSYSR